MNRLPFIAFGAIIGVLGGFSFGMVIYPWVADQLLPDLPGQFYLNVATVGPVASLLWAPVGGLAAYWGGVRRSTLTMGVGGMCVGALFGVLVAPGSDFVPLVALAAAIALLYGAGAGFLIGAGLPDAEMIPPEKAKVDAEIQAKGEAEAKID